MRLLDQIIDVHIEILMEMINNLKAIPEGSSLLSRVLSAGFQITFYHTLFAVAAKFLMGWDWL